MRRTKPQVTAKVFFDAWAYIRHYYNETHCRLADTDAAAARLPLDTIIGTVGDGIFHPLSFIQITYEHTFSFVPLISYGHVKPHVRSHTHTHIHTYTHTHTHTHIPENKYSHKRKSKNLSRV